MTMYEGFPPPGYTYHEGLFIPDRGGVHGGEGVDEVELIRRRVILARGYYQPLKDIQDSCYEYFDLENKFEVPIDGYKLPFPGARVQVNTIVDHLIPSRPYIKVEPSDRNNKEAQDLAALHERMYNAVFYMAGRQALAYNADMPGRAAAKDGCIAGEFCFEVLDQTYLWPDEPKREPGEATDEFKERQRMYEEMMEMFAPAYFGICDPRWVMIDPGKPPRWAIKEYDRHIVDIIAQLDAWEREGVDVSWISQLRTGSSATANQTRKWTEYWGIDNDGKHIKAFLVDLQLVVGPIDNELGFIPFTKMSIGAGRGGPSTPPEDRVWGIIRTVMDLYDALGRRLSQMDSLVARFSWPTWVFTGNAQQAKINVGPNAVSYVPPGSKLEAVFPPAAVVQPLLEEMRELHGLTEWATAPDILKGQSAGGREAAYMYVTRLQEARLILDSLREAMQLAYVEACYKVAKIIKRLDRKVTITGLTATNKPFYETIDPKQIDTSLKLTVELLQEIPAENDRRQMIGMQLWEKGAIDWWTFQEEYRKNADPDGTYKNLMLWKFLNSPEVQQYLNEDVALAYDEELYQKLVMARMQAMEQQGAPPMVEGGPSLQQLALMDGIAANDPAVMVAAEPRAPEEISPMGALEMEGAVGPTYQGI